VVFESEEEKFDPCACLGEKPALFLLAQREAASDRAILHVWTSVGMWTRCE